MASTINPLPSLIRASAWDAGNESMRKANRKVWSRDDFNVAAETQERLIRACYGAPGDGVNSPLCFIRFQVAEQAERAGQFDLKSNFKKMFQLINEAVCAAA